MLILGKVKQLMLRRKMNLLMRDQFYSSELRTIFREKYDIDIGLYSYGCFDHRRFNRKTVFGRYCSVADSARRFGRNHPMGCITTHPFFYNSKLGIVSADGVEYSRCIFEDDVWVGANSIVLPRVSFVGRGSVIAAGAVVTKDVPRYAIVAGNPAKVIAKRFSSEKEAWIEKSEWWNMDIEELVDWLESNCGNSLNPLGRLPHM